jgi:hypothetical protein
MYCKAFAQTVEKEPILLALHALHQQKKVTSEPYTGLIQNILRHQPPIDRAANDENLSIVVCIVEPLSYASGSEPGAYPNHAEIEMSIPLLSL